MHVYSAPSAEQCLQDLQSNFSHPFSLHVPRKYWLLSKVKTWKQQQQQQQQQQQEDIIVQYMDFMFTPQCMPGHYGPTNPPAPKATLPTWKRWKATLMDSWRWQFLGLKCEFPASGYVKMVALIQFQKICTDLYTIKNQSILHMSPNGLQESGS